MSSLQDIQLQIVLQVQGLANVGQISRQLGTVASAADNVTKKAQAVTSVNRSQITSWGALTQQLGDVERRYDAVFRAGVHMTQMGDSLIGMSRQITNVIGGAVSAWGTFEFTLNRAAGAMDIFDTQSKLYDKLKTSIYGAAQQARLFPANDIAKATYFWQSTTGETIKTEQQLQRVLTNVTTAMETASLTQSDYETVIKGGYSIMKQYGMSLNDIPNIMKSLFVETQRTALELPDLIQSFKYVGPLANSLGISFETVSKTLGILGDLGQRGSQAGRGLGMLLTQLVRPAPKGIKAMNQLFAATMHVQDGYNKLVFPKGKFVGLEKFVTLLANSTKNLTQQQRLNYITTIVGTQNAARVIIPLIDAQIAALKRGSSVFADPKYSLVGAAKDFDKAFGLLKNSWQGMVGLLKETVEPIILQVGASIAKSLTPFIEKASEVAQKIQDWVKNNPKLVDFAVKVAGIAAAALAASGALFIVGGSILFLIGNIGNFVQGIGKVMIPFAALIALMAGFVALVVNNVGGMRDAFGNLAKSVGEMVTAIMGDGFDLKKSWQSVFDFLKPYVTDAAKAIAGALNFLADVIHNLAQNKTFVDWARRVIDIFIKYRAALTILATLSGALWAAGKAMTFFTGALKIMSGYSTIVSLWKGLGTAVSVMSGAWTALTGLVPAIIGFFTSLNTGILATTVSIGGLDIALAPVIGIIAAIILIGAALYLAWTNNWGGIRDIVGNVAGFITNVVGGVLNWFTGTFLPAIGNIVGGVIGFFASLPDNIAGVWNTIITGVANFVSTVFNDIVGFLQNFANNWAYYLGYALGFIIGWLIKIPLEVAKFIITMTSDFLGFLGNLPGWFADWFGQVWNGLVAWFGKAIPAIGSWLGQVVGQFVTWIGSLPGRFVGWLGSVFSDMATWFANLAVSAAKWASNVVGGIVKWFHDLPGNIIDALASLPGELLSFFLRLPGMIWDAIVGIGKAIITGIWSGIQNLFKWLVDRVHDFFNGILDAVKNVLGIHSPSKVFAEIGGHMVAGLAVGIQANRDAHAAMQNYTDSLVAMATGAGTQVTSALSDLTGQNDPSMSLTSSAERVVRVELNLTSSDGSVDQYTLDQLKSSLTGSDLVSALESMAGK